MMKIAHIHKMSPDHPSVLEEDPPLSVVLFFASVMLAFTAGLSAMIITWIVTALISILVFSGSQTDAGLWLGVVAAIGYASIEVYRAWYDHPLIKRLLLSMLVVSIGVVLPMSVFALALTDHL